MTSTITDTEHIDTLIGSALAPSLRPPDAARFVDEAGQSVDFLAAPALETMADDLIARLETLAHLAGVDVVYLWKAEGGKSKGRLTLGKCVKASGLVKHFSDAAFCVWLAADHVRTLALSDRQVEALLAHELGHIGWDEEADQPIVRGHDLEEFGFVVAAYGLYMADVRAFDATLRQLRLPATAD